MTFYNLIPDLYMSGINLQKLTGYDEKFLAETKKWPSFKRSIYLLSRLLEFTKEQSNLNRSQRISKIYRFTIGQRTALMLHLRKMIIGNTFRCVADCPKCNSEMSIDLSVDKILQLDDYIDFKKENNIKVNEFQIQIKPLNGLDQETFFSHLTRKENEIGTNKEDKNIDNLSTLTKLCIINSEPSILENNRLSIDIISAISEKLEQIDPISNIVLNLICYKCNNTIQMPFYIEEFILNEIDSRWPLLEWEIHWIALNYHWSEREILSLSLNQRKRYMELINKTLKK